MDRHTPGPWGAFVFGACRIIQSKCKSLYFVLPYGKKEDASLIAAAPEMKEALVNLIHAIDDAETANTSNPDIKEYVEKRLAIARNEARAVLAKVEGEE